MMHKLAFLILIPVFVLECFCGLQTCAIGADAGLLAWWKCDETSGTLVRDYGPNHADGTLSSADVRATDLIGGYLNLTATNTGYLTTSYNPLIRPETSNFAVSFWFAPPQIQIAEWRLVYSDGYPEGWWCIDISDGLVQMEMGLTPLEQPTMAVGPTSQMQLVEGRWNHVVICVDRQNYKVSFYMNGVLDGTYDFDNRLNGSIWSKPTGLYIGSPWQRATGCLADFQLYDRILTAQEVADSYAAYPRKDIRTSEIATNRLSPIFTDHMVLQRDRSVPVYGKAADGSELLVSFAGQSKTSVAVNGKWRVDLDPLSGTAVGRDMTVSIKDKVTSNTATTILHDVVVGEVWLASGQSNMEWPLSMVITGGWGNPVPEADHPNIRFFIAGKNTLPANRLIGAWNVCTPVSVSMFSAVAYYFARDLSQDLNLPVGIVGSYWGGTIIEAWMNHETFDDDPDYAPIATAYANKTTPFGPQNVPAVLYDAMIKPLMPYGIRGAIWYQGESNAGEPALYRKLLSTMVRDWRRQWGQGAFPFYVVQLPKISWDVSSLRDAQWAATRQLPNSGIAVTIDTGSAVEIHPPDKEPVGTRLSLLARAKTYGENIVYCGPEYRSMEIKGSQVWLSFDHIGSGLKSMVPEPLPEFQICGQDQAWKTATASIVGDRVLVRSWEVSNPIAVRYDWSAAPALSLGNNEGFPAAPFWTASLVSKSGSAKADMEWMSLK